MSKQEKEVVWLDLPGGTRSKEKDDVQPLLDAGLMALKEGTVQTYVMTDTGRRAYITGDLTDAKEEKL